MGLSVFYTPASVAPMESPNPPFLALLDRIGKPAAEVAREAGISNKSAYDLKAGRPCGAVVWRRLSARYGLEIRQLGLTAEDFLAGQVLAGPVGRRA